MRDTTTISTYGKSITIGPDYERWSGDGSLANMYTLGSNKVSCSGLGSNEIGGYKYYAKMAKWYRGTNWTPRY